MMLGFSGPRCDEISGAGWMLVFGCALSLLFAAYVIGVHFNVLREMRMRRKFKFDDMGRTLMLPLSSLKSMVFHGDLMDCLDPRPNWTSVRRPEELRPFICAQFAPTARVHLICLVCSFHIWEYKLDLA